MPYIQIRTNSDITEEKEIKIKEKLGEAISIVGKSEQWLMIEFVPNCRLFFKGKNDSLIAYIDIKLYGHADASCYNTMTYQVTNIINEELNIDPNQIYISYSEYEYWGQNGRNF